MKVPEKVNRYCPYCKKHTKQNVAVAKQKSRSSAHPLSRGSTARLMLRGLRRGFGNQGRYSKPAIKNWKRKSKSTKRLTIMYTCSICKKSKGIKQAIRTSRLEVGDKIAK
jgi:large subunit ribosomal protein L44e